MKKNGLLISTVLVGLLFNGYGNSELKAEDISTIENTKISQESDELAIEVSPVLENKVEVITKVKPKISVVSTETLEEGEQPIVVIDPVDVEVPVEEVDILPVVDNTVGIVTTIKPTIEVIEELPIEEDAVPEVVLEPIVE